MIAQSCLTGYIWIPGCGSETPESGLWITDHPGFPLQMFDKIADSDKQTWKAVWEVIEKRAINRLVSDVTNYFGSKYRLRKVTDNVRLPIDVNTATNQTAQAAEYRGFEVELDFQNSEWAHSSLQIIHFQEIRFYSKAAISGVVFKIRDLLNGIDLESKTVNVVVGWNTIWANKHYASYHLFVGYDSTGIDSVELLLPDEVYGCDCFDSCSGCCDSRIRGMILNGATGKNLYGMSGIVSVNCSFESVICANKYLFRNALWYGMAYEALRERAFTERLNKFTTVDRTILKEEMLPEAIDQYKFELEQVTAGIDLNDSCCLECDSQVHYAEARL